MVFVSSMNDYLLFCRMYDCRMYDDPRDPAQSNAPQRGGAAASNKKPVKEPKKSKKREDPMVEVMAQYVEIKRKQAEEESALLAG